jgi:hypothetical protein
MRPMPLWLTPELETSKNALIKSLSDPIRRYNLLFPTAANIRAANTSYVIEPKMVALLDAMSITILGYLLHKPPAARKESGRVKWNAAVAFKDLLAAHADFFGIRFMKSDMRDAAGMNYWLERANTAFTGHDGFEIFLKWARSTAKKSFAEAFGAADSDLAYFDEAARAQYRVRLSGQVAYTADDDLLDTGSGQGAYSEIPNTFIYVCSARDRNIYSGPCAPGALHHSSFLSGEPIIAGGDWMVDNGKVIYINAASGHYRPTAGGMALFARLFQGRLSPDTLIQPEHEGAIYLLRDFLIKGLASPLPVDALEEFADRLGPKCPVEKVMRKYALSKGMI